jgi:hypothetical protein|nr:hypothetical protein [Kofleriaceae bacterium]
MKLLVLALVTVVAGCTKDTGPDAANAFVGAWSCTSQIVYKFSSPPGIPDKTVSLDVTRTYTGGGDHLESTSVTSTGVSTGCVTKWKVAGTTATTEPGQTCSSKVTTPGGALREVSGTHMTATSNLSGATFHETGSGDVDIVEGPQHFVGAGTTTTICTRK